MNQQRSRRFRSAQEAAQADEDKKELVKMLKSQSGEEWEEGREEEITKKTWDSNQITPGTPFMFLLAESLRYWCAYKLNTDPGWDKLKVILSDASVPGEGEHKIMEFIRSQRASPFHDPNTHHVLYGLDADLIMLGLATHEPHFDILREDVFYKDAAGRTCRLCGQKGHKAEECRGEAKQKDGEFDEKDKTPEKKPFIWLHVSVLREYLAIEMTGGGQPFPFDLERALDDWVFMCFFCGNDFLPHLPSLEIRENGIDTLINIWRQSLPLLDGYVTEDGYVHLDRAQHILDGLAKQEDGIFQRRRSAEERQEANAKRRKIEQEARRSEKGQSNGRKSPDYSKGASKVPEEPIGLYAPGKGETLRDVKSVTYDMAVNRGAARDANTANKSAAAMLKNKLMGKQTEAQPPPDDSPTANGAESTPPSVLGKRKADLLETDDASTPEIGTPSEAPAKKDNDEPPPDTVRLWEPGYADRYYEQKFGKAPEDIAFRNKVASHYVEGLAWVLLYYFQGCPSWSWFYPYHYAPFAADFVDIAQTNLEFDKSEPLRPYEQLMSVLPAASNSAIPEVFRSLMSDDDSEIIDFYPTEFKIDLNGKKMSWQGVAILPFVEMDRLLGAMAKRYPLLTDDEVTRNERGKPVLLFSDRHPLFTDVAATFFSKRQGASKMKLNMKMSEGLAGKIEKNPEHLPEGPLLYPFVDGLLPNLDTDQSMRYLSS
jgi:5'-3' exoribonuclease 2